MTSNVVFLSGERFLFKNHVLLFCRVSLRAVLDGAQNVLDQNNSISLPSGTKPEFLPDTASFTSSSICHMFISTMMTRSVRPALSAMAFSGNGRSVKIGWMRPALIPAVIPRWTTVFEIRAGVPKVINDFCVINQKRVELTPCCAIRWYFAFSL